MKKTRNVWGAVLLAVCLCLNGIPTLAQETVPPETISTETSSTEAIPPELDSTEVVQTFSNKLLRGTPDYNPPELVNISIDKTEVTAPGTITVTATATDDVSGVEYVSVKFRNEESGNRESVSLFDDDHTGVFTGRIKFNEYATPEIYTLRSVSVGDKNNNSQEYWLSSDENRPDSAKPLKFNLSFTVKNNTAMDTTPPELVSLLIDKTEVEAPGTITVTATATDDVSGVEYINVKFWNKENKNRVSIVLYDDDNTELFTSQIKIDQYMEPEKFTLRSVSVFDKNNNYQDYWTSDDTSAPENAKPLLEILEFTVKNNATIDKIPPELVSISIDKTEVEAPGTVVVKAVATDNKSGVESINVRFRDKSTGDRQSISLFEKDKEGNFIDILEISQYARPGILTLDRITLFDAAGNTKSYYASDAENIPEGEELLLPEWALTITVTNGTGTEFVTNTANPKLAEKIAEQPDGTTIVVNYGTGSRIPANVFDAIKDSDKTLIFESNGVRWEFHGKDIGMSKAIDLNVEMDDIRVSSSSGNVNAIVLDFAANGKLPGKAIISAKMDYTFREYLGGSTGLYVYYHDRQTGGYVLVAENVDLTANDDLSFEIDHNSEYVVTKGSVNFSTGGGGGSGGGSSGGGGGGGAKASGAGTADISKIKTSTAVSATNAAMKTAIANAVNNPQQEATAIIKLTAGTKLSKEATVAIQKAVKAAQAKATVTVMPRISIEQVKNKTLLYRMQFDPMKLAAKNTVDYALVIGDKSIQSLFNKYFSNQIAVVKFAQQGAFDTAVEVTVQLDISKLDATKPLYLYTYNKAENQFQLLEHANASIDKDGYLHFTTSTGNYMIVTDRPLALK